jgi:hypothetical protein
MEMGEGANWHSASHTTKDAAAATASSIAAKEAYGLIDYVVL